MSRQKKIGICLAFVFLFCILYPLNVNAAQKFWSTTLSNSDYNIFQENSTNEIDTDAIITMIPTGKYKFIFYNGKNYITMNNSGGYSNDLDTTLANTDVTTKGTSFRFSLFNDKSDYTPKEYLAMLQRSKIYVYDKSNTLVTSFNALDYKDYTEFPSSKNFSVKFIQYIKNEGENVGVRVNVGWSLGKEEYPVGLTIKNPDVEYEQSYSLDSGSKNTMTLDLELSCNGKYTFYLFTNTKEYEQTLDFDKLALDSVDIKDTKKDTKFVEDEKVSTKKVTIEVGKIPNSLDSGKSFNLDIKTNIDTTVDLSGRTDANYQTKHSFSITENGTYQIKAISEAGKIATKTIKVNCFKEPKANVTYYDRDSYWTGDQTPIDNQETLVQTGMYNNTIIVVAIMCLLFGVMLICQVLRKAGFSWKRK